MYKIQPKTVFIGKSTEYLPVCHSTNDYCQLLMAKNKPENGYLVYTDYQTAGRGQRGNIWEADAGENILMTLILEPTFLKASNQFQLNMAVALGILTGIKNFISDIDSNKLKIKWPNDLYFENRKLGGILIENTILGSNLNHSFVGIGLNINQLKFDNIGAVSVLQVSNKLEKFEIGAIITKICEDIEYYYLKLKKGENLDQNYLEALYRMNEFHTFTKNEQSFIGKITGLDSIGRLKIEVENELQVFNFKEVNFVI